MKKTGLRYERLDDPTDYPPDDVCSNPLPAVLSWQAKLLIVLVAGSAFSLVAAAGFYKEYRFSRISLEQFFVSSAFPIAGTARAVRVVTRQPGEKDIENAPACSGLPKKSSAFPGEPVMNAAPAIRAVENEPSAKLTPPLTGNPPPNLAEGAEVAVVSGYEADDDTGNGIMVQVSIDRPGKDVLLVLTSNEEIAWKVNASGGTRIKGILFSGNKQSNVRANVDTAVYQVKLPYSYDKNSGNFAKLLKRLNQLLGVQKIDVFRGKYDLPHLVEIKDIDPPQSDLTLRGDEPQAPSKPLRFTLVTADYGKAQWSLTGPLDKSGQAALAAEKSVKSPRDQRIYRIFGHDFELFDPVTGQKAKLNFPDNFPRLSWPTDVAYDQCH